MTKQHDGRIICHSQIWAYKSEFIVLASANFSQKDLNDFCDCAHCEFWTIVCKYGEFCTEEFKQITTEKIDWQQLKEHCTDSGHNKGPNNIQVTLNSINNRLDKLESVGRSVDDLKADIYNENGIDHRLKVAENQRTDRKIEEMDREITDLRGRSMRDNILTY